MKKKIVAKANIKRLGGLPSTKTKCKIRAFRDFVWCRPITERVVGNIIIPEAALDLKNPMEAIVVAVGCGLVEGGAVVPLTVKVGDRVEMPANVGTLIRIKETEEEFFVCRENILFGAVEVPE